MQQRDDMLMNLDSSHAMPADDVNLMPRPVCIHERFDLQARLTPEAVAVIDGNRITTYASLQQRARELAGRLRARGVGPDVPVALLSARSTEAVVGILGILEAGGAYVPLDPHDPDPRLATILEDSDTPLVLVHSSLRERLDAAVAEIIEFDDGNFADADAGQAPAINAATTLDHLAAIVYTSGSTGTPKGVEIPHRSIMARVRNGYRPRRHDLQKAPLSVVAHFSDLLVPLLFGGPVIIVPDECLSSGRALLDVIVRHGTSRMVFVPSQLSALLEGGSEVVSALARLDSVIVSGESLTPGLVRTFKRLLPHTVLLNAYGASEVAGLACMGEVSSPDDITVGSAIGQCAVYVLDDGLRPLPPGVVGEVHVGGAQVARGYRGTPVLTEERFVSNPFSDAACRMYRTGDLAERLADGRLRIVGRRDVEVKVHGFRVNLNEVEAALDRVPSVERAVVTFDGADAHPRLTAHVLTQSPTDAGAATSLRAAVAAQLPSYMVPGSIRFVAAFPSLRNGKVDRLALATLDSTAPRSGQPTIDSYVPPETATERALAAIWQSLLGVPAVSVTDDFFALGGDSLDAVRFSFRAEEMGLSVTLQQLQDAPSLAALARAIDEATAGCRTTGSMIPTAQ